MIVLTVLQVSLFYCLYIFDVGLDISIASRYLHMDNCYRSLHLTDYDLEGIFSNTKSDLYLNLREDLVDFLPKHWSDKLKDIFEFHVQKYPVDRVLNDLCLFNDKKLTSLFDFGGLLCPFQEEQLNSLRHVWNDVVKDENEILLGILNKNMSSILSVLNIPGIEDFPHIKDAFTEEEINLFFEFLSSEPMSSSSMNVFESLFKIESADLFSIQSVFSSMNISYIPRITSLLTDLNITLTDFITQPVLFLSYLRDPTKAQILLEMQSLLPVFTPSDINSILKIMKAMENVQHFPELLNQLLQKIPISLLLKAANVLFNHSESIKKFGNFLSSHKYVYKTITELELHTSSGRSAFLHQCLHEKFDIRCLDSSTDLCPNGHLFYGILSLFPIALPGILYSISSFHHSYLLPWSSLSTFGSHWNIFVKLLLLPLYCLLMIPGVFLLILVNYCLLIKKAIFSGRNEDIKDRMATFLCLTSLEGFGESFLQIIIQSYFLSLLISFGGSTIIAGVDTSEFFYSIMPQTVISLCVSALSLTVSGIELQKYDRNSKNLNRHQQETPIGQISNVTIEFLWFFVSILIKLGSSVGLCLLVWIEMLSDSFLQNGVSLNIYLLPLFLLLTPIPLNAFLHLKLISNTDEFSLAHGILSSVFPSRYLHASSRTNTRTFLICNQVLGSLTHMFAWLTYGFIIYIKHGETFGQLSLFPPVLALFSLGPFLGMAHWSLNVRTLYETVGDEEKIITSSYFNVWRLFGMIVRASSFSILFFVNYEHYIEVNFFNFRFALLELIPFLILLFVSNMSLSLMSSNDESIWRGIFSIFIPKKTNRWSYLWLNVLWNLLLHCLMLAIMTFYCWQCTEILSLHKLKWCLPIAAILWLSYILSTTILWSHKIRKTKGSNYSSSTSTTSL